MNDLHSKGLLNFKEDTGYFDAKRVKAFAKEFNQAIEPYETSLLRTKHFATEAAQKEIMDIIKDIDHARDYYERLAKDHNVLRTEAEPRFRQTNTPEFKTWFGDWESNQGNVKIDKNRLIVDGEDVGLIEHSDKGAYIEVEKLYIDKDKQKQGHGTKAIAHLANKYGKEIKLYPLEAAPFLNMGVKRMDGEMLVLDTDKYNSSKVVDRGGNPLTMYHGTKSDFNKFETTEKNATDVGKLGVGHYFTDSHSVANAYAHKGSIMPVYINVQNPFIIDFDLSGRNPNQLREAARELGISDNINLQTSESDARIPKEWAEAWTKALNENGYDGVIVNYSDQTKEVMALNPTQIKSAIGNIGTFDSENADIRFRKDQDFRDAHGAPAMDYETLREAIEESGDVNLSEIITGRQELVPDSFLIQL